MQLVSMSNQSATLQCADGRTVVVSEGLPVQVTGGSMEAWQPNIPATTDSPSDTSTESTETASEPVETESTPSDTETAPEVAPEEAPVETA